MLGVVYPALAKLVESPRPDPSILSNREGVVRTGSDVPDLTPRKTELARNEPIEAGSLDDTSPELELLTIAPGVDISFLRKAEDMISADANLNYVLKRRQ